MSEAKPLEQGLSRVLCLNARLVAGARKFVMPTAQAKSLKYGVCWVGFLNARLVTSARKFLIPTAQAKVLNMWCMLGWIPGCQAGCRSLEIRHAHWPGKVFEIWCMLGRIPECQAGRWYQKIRHARGGVYAMGCHGRRVGDWKGVDNFQQYLPT